VIHHGKDKAAGDEQDESVGCSGKPRWFWDLGHAVRFTAACRFFDGRTVPARIWAGASRS